MDMEIYIDKPRDIGSYHVNYLWQWLWNQILNFKSYPRAVINSDNNLVIMEYRMKLKRLYEWLKKDRYRKTKIKVNSECAVDNIEN